MAFRNVSNVVSGTEARLRASFPTVSDNVLRIIECLNLVIIPFRSHREVWFTDREYSLYLSSLLSFARKLTEYEQLGANREQDFCKFWFATWLCRASMDTTGETPPVPSWLIRPRDKPFEGFLHRLIMRRLARSGRGRLSFFDSLYQSKRGWPPLSDERKEAAYQKHYDLICRDRPQTDADMTSAIVRTSLKVFSPKGPTDLCRFTVGTSATLQASRRDGGASAAAEPFVIPHDTIYSETVDLRRADGTFRRVEIPLPRALVDVQLFDVWREKTWSLACERAKVDPSRNDVRVAAVPEPSKFRMVTMGSADLGLALQPLQGYLLSRWKRQSQSTMLMQAEDVLERVRVMDEIHEPEDDPDVFEFNAADYASATDTLPKTASKAAFAGVPDQSPMRSEGLDSLSGGLITYPEGSGVVDGEGLAVGTADQRNGQLMGHPLSFPLLCVINLACLEEAVRLWVEEMGPDYRDLGVKIVRTALVNGDDLLFRGPSRLRVIFREVAVRAGFEFSLGKNYSSPDTALINSQRFVRVDGRMEVSSYINLNLVLHSCTKKAANESTATPEQFGRALNRMVKFCPASSCLIPMAFAKWEKLWPSGFKPNWYLPLNLGGYGLDPELAPPSMKVSLDQRLVAARFIAKPSLSLFFRKGVKPHDVRAPGLSPSFRFDIVPKGWGPLPFGLGRAEDVEDEWGNRLAAMAHAMRPLAKPSAPRVRRQKTWGRLEPMSDEAIEAYRNASLVGAYPPVCPPLQPLARVVPDAPYRPSEIDLWEEAASAPGPAWDPPYGAVPWVDWE